MAKKGGNYSFHADLELGENGEDDIVRYLESLGYKYISRNHDNRYDIIMEYKGRHYTFEIKTDVYPRDTGNIAVEVECRGKPSGLSVTEADFFVTYFKHYGEIWNIRTSKLRDLVKNGNFYLKEGAGDKGSNTKIFLMKKNIVKHYFKIHKIDRGMLYV